MIYLALLTAGLSGSAILAIAGAPKMVCVSASLLIPCALIAFGVLQ